MEPRPDEPAPDEPAPDGRAPDEPATDHRAAPASASPSGDALPGPDPAWHHGLGGPALVFFTSAAVLVIEILAGRLVAPYVGDSLETYTGIIGTVLAGIALGAGVGGWVADRRDPRELLGPLLVVSGIAVLVSLPIISLIGPNVAGTSTGPPGIVLLAVTAFVLPTALLSAVSPMVAKLRLASMTETGSVFGGLSAAGTAGALLGTFTTGFILVAAWPTRPIMVGVGLLVAAAGVVVAVVLRRQTPTALLMAFLGTGLLALVAPSPCERETRYFCVDVVADPRRDSGRTLVLDNLRHSYVDLDDPRHLEFQYARDFAAVVDANLEGPIDALHVGGGGFTFPRWLRATRPGTTSRVLELDPDIVTIAEQELGLVTGLDLTVRTGDARLNMTDEPDGAYDLVVGDAFGSLSVPWHLTTVEFVRDLERTLRPGGLYILNMIDTGPRRLVRAQLATMQQVFDHVAVVLPRPGQPANQVLIGTDDELALDPSVFEGELLTGDALAAFIDGAEPLRDDFAPAEQLLTRR